MTLVKGVGVAKTANPFKPGMAVTPPALVGRDRWLADFAAALDITKRREPPSPAMMLLGVRGVGKTVLLQQFVLAARDVGFAAVRLTVDPDPDRSLAVQLSEELPRLVDQLRGKTRKPRAGRAAISSVKAAVNLGVVSGEITAGPSVTHPANLTAVVRYLSEHALAAGRGVAIMVDELQDATVQDLRAFARVIQEAAAENLPIVVVGAGLPILQLRAPEAGATSFTERADWSAIPFLTASQTRTALQEPARRADVEFRPDALGLLVDEAGGYPYTVQLLGRNAWNASGDSNIITIEHAITAVTVTRNQLDDGLYGLRWNKCTPREKAVLTAVALLERDTAASTVRIADVAASLNASTTQLSTQRDALIRKELIEPAGRGELRLTLPGMGASILRTTNITNARQLAEATNPRITAIPPDRL